MTAPDRSVDPMFLVFRDPRPMFPKLGPTDYACFDGVTLYLDPRAPSRILERAVVDAVRRQLGEDTVYARRVRHLSVVPPVDGGGSGA